MKTNLFNILAILFLAPVLKTSGQTIQEEGPTYRESFFNFYHTMPDSAVVYARKLASYPEYSVYLRQTLHNDLPLMFTEATRLKYLNEARANSVTETEFKVKYDSLISICYTTVQKMAIDSNKQLARNAMPMYYWVSVQRSLQDTKKVIELVTEFMRIELPKKEWFQNGTGRYAVMIYKEIAQAKQFDFLAEELLSTTINRLESLHMDLDLNSASTELLAVRAWYRLVYASANDLMANRLVKKGQKHKAYKYFKTAANYSPDITDLNRTRTYRVDLYLLADNKIDLFQTNYLHFLQFQEDDKAKALEALTGIAIRNPSVYKPALRTFYNDNFAKEDFQKFWEKKVNENLTQATAFKIKLINGSMYSSSEQSGKWILIDFWGTWCTPCREEHPSLQKFYTRVLADHSDKISILTVACNDKENIVNEYMSRLGYSFPVAMQDDELIKSFKLLKIKEYPTKILISPQGRYFVVPHSDNWVEFVKQYASL